MEVEKEVKFLNRGLGFKKKHIAWFLYQTRKGYERVKRKRIRTGGKKIIKYANNPFYIELGKSSFTKGLNEYYLFDIQTAKQLFFAGIETVPISKDDMDLILIRKVFGHFFSSLLKKIKMNWGNLITGIAIGGFIGLVLGGIFL